MDEFHSKRLDASAEQLCASEFDETRGDVFEYIERPRNPRMRRRTARQNLKFFNLFTTVRDIEVEPL